MSCKHLQELYQLCHQYNLKLTGSELVRIVCPTCGVDEICPNVLMEEYDRRHSPEEAPPTSADETKVTSPDQVKGSSE
ncbi:MAG TPA: hypothetical protein PL064_02075 [Thermogutta sp.]|nr:hypothetical protein [Thermogutta sp.]HPU05654.1 hypothetical protein [Thermogutta sp.]HPZ82190.1 hypothetical protein [Thermogutta sp.]HQF14413.1 hypothetical protein [Thermogutta sp.]